MLQEQSNTRGVMRAAAKRERLVAAEKRRARDEIIIAVYKDGKSAEQAGKAAGVNRNIASGVLFRAGLVGKGKRPDQQLQARLQRAEALFRKVKARKERRAVKDAKRIAMRDMLPAPLHPVYAIRSVGHSTAPSMPPPQSEPKPLIRLTETERHHCRWIIGPRLQHAMCCGRPTLSGKSWCPTHAAKALEPVRPMRVAHETKRPLPAGRLERSLEDQS